MSVSLAFHYNCWRQTLITHTLGERLVIRTVIVDFVAEFLERHAVLAFLVCLVLSLAFGFDL